MFQSRNSGDESDTLQLSKLLDSLESELEVSFLERRKVQKLRKSTSLEELQDAVEQISQREKDLQACIGIAKMLIETNDRYLYNNRELIQEKENLEDQVKGFVEEIENYKEKLDKSEERLAEVSEALMKSEAKIIKLSTENTRKEESSPKIIKHSPEIETISIDRYDADITELTDRYKQEYEQVLRKNHIGSKEKAKEKLKTTEDELAKTKSSLISLEADYDSLLKELNSLRKSLKKRDEEFKLIQDEHEDLEQRFDQLHKKHQELIEHCEKITEEMEILEMSNQYRQPESHSRENKSLKIELEDLEEAIEDPFPELPDQFQKRTFSIRNSFRVGPRSLQVVKALNLHIIPVKIRKNPGEEYFTLSTQAIKLNSPYMDVICIESPKVLYDLAIKNDVPFHKWHEWIEKKLNAKYLETIYKKGKKIN
ncbi:hypothetical protein SteCoe_28656 [Stentor coeruleus]|uniref:Uncharacterized protein n=1 Tax=Stentor coeruleus TaxID=5963 RepID=A0A1R2B7R2_9CILI|nr:hypothetical protein SteCoe_28656 [Stentor coeruleus]